MPVPGRNLAILFDGTELTEFFTEFEFERKGDSTTIPVFANGKSLVYTVAGSLEGTYSLDGIYEGDYGEVDEVLHYAFEGTGHLLTLCPDTRTAGKSCYLAPVVQAKYTLKGKADESIETEAELGVDGAADRGFVLNELVQVSGATGAGPAVTTTSTADAVATTAGAVFHLHVKTQGGLTGTTPTLDVKIQGSADGTTAWTDVTGAAFAQVTATSANRWQRLVIPAGVSIPAYLRAYRAIGGSGSPTATFLVAGARLR